MAVVKDEYWKYIPLYQAAVRGDWESAKRLFFDKDKGALTARITAGRKTSLHVAVGTGKRAIHFVEQVVGLMSKDELELTDLYGGTALFNAALVGNTKAASTLVQKNPASLYIQSNTKMLPIHIAAQNGHEDTLRYLLTVTKDDDDPVLSKAFSDQSGVLLLILVISSGFYDIALNMVHRYPHLAKSRLDNGDSALGEICMKVSAFPSGSRLNGWQRLIYSYVSVKLEKYADEDQHHRGDIENPVNSSQVIAHNSKWARSLVESFSIFVPHIKHIREQKLMHLQARELVKSLCKEILSINDSHTHRLLYKEPFLQAAMLGIHEALEEIVESFPQAVWSNDSENCYIFQLAVIHRCENVFNLVYQMGGHKQYIAPLKDNFNNTILHLAGRLAPQNKLNLVPSAALQMQRELQWFKEVEKFVNPKIKSWRNKDGDTPTMVFTKSHEKLAKEGEKWMKDTANSCTIAAALIATIAFAAAITVPGGNNSADGLPLFSKERAFIIFAISDAISLFTSTTSLLMFLSILTSRYAEGDFLYVLPKRLIIGLLTLFLSITTMIIAFSSTLYLVFGQKNEWILVPVATIACLPIYSFVSLQFPLLVDLISSTFGRGIFGKQSDRPFY